MSRRRIIKKDILPVSSLEKKDIEKKSITSSKKNKPPDILTGPLNLNDLLSSLDISEESIDPYMIKKKTDDFLELSEISCGCGKRIGGNYGRMITKLQEKKKKFYDENNREFSIPEYDEMIGNLLDEEKSYGLIRGCCRSSLKLPLIIPPTSEKYDLASYRGFSSEVKKLESLGNMKLQRVNIGNDKKIQYNPYKYVENKYFNESDIEEIKQHKKIDNDTKIEEVPSFLSMPAHIREIIEYDEFEDKKNEPVEYYLVGKAHTGIKGYETPVIREKYIIAR